MRRRRWWQHAEAMIHGAEHDVNGMFAEKPLCCSLVEVDVISAAFERNGIFLEFGLRGARAAGND